VEIHRARGRVERTAPSTAARAARSSAPHLEINWSGQSSSGMSFAIEPYSIFAGDRAPR